MEPPSVPLQKLLEECGLCRRAELRRCQPRVRRLARDLPAFDSVWIDALLQARLLTVYQARVLSSSTPERIRVGPCVLEQRLGGGAWSETYQARVIGSSTERRALKRLVVPSDVRDAVHQRLQRLVDGSAESSHPGVVAPRLVRRKGTELVLVSSFVEGASLRELLIRRGRFPAEVVEQVGRALVEALAGLERLDQLHGDLLLTNVKLTGRGEIVAVDAGVSPAIQPSLVIDTARSPARYDGTAPERIESLGRATTASDMYALGCLLFELLAGRPPFPVADPVMKLAAHQSRHIADVRTWAPETPRRLAEAIGQLCAHDPGNRPEKFVVAGQDWGQPGRSTRRTVGEFVERFRSAAPASGGTASHRRRRDGKKISVAVAVMVACSGMWLAFGGLSAAPSLMMRQPAARGVFGTPEDPAAARIGAEDRQQRKGGVVWPGFDGEGRVQLDASRVWPGTSLSRSGAVIIEAAENSDPQIAIETGQPLSIVAQVVVLRGLTFRGRGSGAWLKIRGGVLRVEDCRFLEAGSEEPREQIALGPAIEISNPGGEGGVFVQLRSMVMQWSGIGVRLRSGDGEVVASNVLQVGGQAWLQWDCPKASGELHVGLDHCTLRRSRGLLSWNRGDVHVEARSTILAIRSGRVLCEHQGEGVSSIVVEGDQSLLTPGAVVSRQAGVVEGMVAAVPTFRGPASSDPRDSVFSRIPVGVPGFDGQRPGIQP